MVVFLHLTKPKLSYSNKLYLSQTLCDYRLRMSLEDEKSYDLENDTEEAVTSKLSLLPKSNLNWENEMHRSSDETVYEERFGRLPKIISGKWLLFATISSALIASIFTVLGMMLFFTHSSTVFQSHVGTAYVSPLANLTCGNTIESAMLHNCTFDQVTDQWLPLECSRVGLDDFLAYSGHGTPWRYWTDQAGEREFFDLSTHHGPYYTTEKEHMAHCAFMLIRVADAYAHPEIRLDERTADYHHTKHCAMMLLKAALNSPTTDVINSYGKVVTGTC